VDFEGGMFCLFKGAFPCVFPSVPLKRGCGNTPLGVLPSWECIPYPRECIRVTLVILLLSCLEFITDDSDATAVADFSV
jgi:hypothetical protein